MWKKNIDASTGIIKFNSMSMKNRGARASRKMKEALVAASRNPVRRSLDLSTRLKKSAATVTELAEIVKRAMSAQPRGIANEFEKTAIVIKSIDRVPSAQTSCTIDTKSIESESQDTKAIAIPEKKKAKPTAKQGIATVSNVVSPLIER